MSGLPVPDYRIDIPLVDGHSLRQVTNADIARHFADSTWNPFTPQASWGGRNGVVGMEFPLLHYVIGLTWRWFGESEMNARLITALFSTASVILIYLLGRDLFSLPVGRGAAFLMAIAPSTVYFGRSVLSDTPMVTFSIAAVPAWHRALSAPTRWRVAIATLCTALAGLVKLPAVIVGLPIAALAGQHRGARLLGDRALWIGGVVSVAAIAAWYAYADIIATRTGLTQAIFRPPGVYGPEIGLALRHIDRPSEDVADGGKRHATTYYGDGMRVREPPQHRLQDGERSLPKPLVSRCACVESALSARDQSAGRAIPSLPAASHRPSGDHVGSRSWARAATVISRSMPEANVRTVMVARPCTGRAYAIRVPSGDHRGSAASAPEGETACTTPVSRSCTVTRSPSREPPMYATRRPSSDASIMKR